MVAAVAVATSCGSSDGETTTGGDATSSVASEPGATDPTGSLPDGCHEAPATTAIGVDGGGEIVCESPGDTGSVGDPNTTIPPATTAPIPAGEGLVRGTLGGSPCSRSHQEQPCIEIFELLTGTVTFDPLDGPADSVSVDVANGTDPLTAGQFEVALAPGRWRVQGAPDTADRTCDAQDVTVAEGVVTEVSILCQAP